MTPPPDARDPEDAIHQTAINAIRFLAVDMVEAASSGHPGAPMAQAPLAYWLWSRRMVLQPEAPRWLNRDRFVLSCGHASALLYALLHLSGHDLSMEELKNFRQLGSKTPGHPESHLTSGVETTTGPLGQGLANAVGMAVAEAFLAARLNREGFPVVDHRVWCIASDGDVMEGITAEASSLAGHLKLHKLTAFWDDNRITIDGSTDLTFTEDVEERYRAYGWHVQRVDDVNDLASLDRAIDAAEAETERPSLIAFRSHIGFGAPNKQDTAAAHGSPLGAEEARAAKEALGWPPDSPFHVPAAAYDAFQGALERGQTAQTEWQALVERYRREHPELAELLDTALAGELPAGWQEALPTFSPEDGPVATRKASGKVLNALAPRLPLLHGGSADLTGSNKTWIDGEEVFSAEHPGGRNFHFGVREHAMGAILNGIAHTGLSRPYGGTFLIFSDYMRPAMRLAAMSELPVIYVLTHDSIFLGEDGPTHQPISQLASLRSIPNMTVLRPADAAETAQAWRVALENDRGPTVLALTRQGLPILEETVARAPEGVARGAYVLVEPEEDAVAVLLATGSEVWVAREAQQQLAADGIPVRLVSMPSWELFAAQDQEYRDSVLPPHLTRRLAVEAASPFGWDRWVGSQGAVQGIDGYGASAPWQDLAEEFGFTPDAVAARVRGMVG